MEIKVTVDKQGNIRFADATSRALFYKLFPDCVITKDGDRVVIKHISLFPEMCGYKCPNPMQCDIELLASTQDAIAKGAKFHHVFQGYFCNGREFVLRSECDGACISLDALLEYREINNLEKITIQYDMAPEEIADALRKFRARTKKIVIGDGYQYSYDYEEKKLGSPTLSIPQPIIDFANSEGVVDVEIWDYDVRVDDPSTWNIPDALTYQTITLHHPGVAAIRMDGDVDFFKTLLQDGYKLYYPNVYLYGTVRHLGELERIKRLFDLGYSTINAAAGIEKNSDGVLFWDKNSDAMGQTVEVDLLQAYTTIKNSGLFQDVGVRASSFESAKRYIENGGASWVAFPSPENEGQEVVVKDGVVHGIVPLSIFSYLAQKLGATKLIDDANGLVFENGELTNICKAPSSLVHEAAKLLDARIDLRKADCQLDPELFKDVKLIADRSYFDRVDNPFDKNIVAVGDYAVTDSLTKAAYLAYGIVLVPRGENLLPGDAHLLEVAQTLANEQGIDVKAALAGILGGGYIAVYKSEDATLVRNVDAVEEAIDGYVQDGAFYMLAALYEYDGNQLVTIKKRGNSDDSAQGGIIFVVGRTIRIKKNGSGRRIRIEDDGSDVVVEEADDDMFGKVGEPRIKIQEDGIEVHYIDEEMNVHLYKYKKLERKDDIYYYGRLQVVDATVEHLKKKGLFAYINPIKDGKPILFVQLGNDIYRRSDVPLGDDEGIPFVIYEQKPLYRVPYVRVPVEDINVSGLPTWGVKVTYRAYDGYSKDITDEFFTTTFDEYFLHREEG